MGSLARFVAFPEIGSGVGPLKLRGVLRDYAVLVEEARVIGLDMQEYLQQQANSAAIEETKRGISQGDSVRRKVTYPFAFL